MEELDETELRIEAELVDDSTAVIVVCGEIDIEGVDAIRAAVRAVVNAGARDLIFDLSDVPFIDSSGIAVLIEARNDAATVALRRPSLPVTRLLVTTGLVAVLPVES